MSIEKYEIESFKKEQIPFDFTILPNIILQNFTHESLAIWCHLMSLPATWEVNREYLMKKFDIGRDKLNGWLKKLTENHLMLYEYNRCTDGKILSVKIVVCNGSEFYKKMLSNQVSLSTTLKTRSVDKSAKKPTTLKNHSLGKPLTGKSAPIKEIGFKKKEKKQTNIRKGCTSVDNFLKDIFDIREAIANG